LAALTALTDRLEQAGWVDQHGDNGTWFGLVLRRPVIEPTSKARASDTVVVARLRHELEQALDVADRERQRRLEAESESRQLAARAARDDVGPSSRPFVVVGYVLAIIYAAAIFLVGFHSLYAAVVAALTAAAVSLAVDCWLITRRRSMTRLGTSQLRHDAPS
jgi:hypothetical protein